MIIGKAMFVIVVILFIAWLIGGVIRGRTRRR
jgi:hypothetical protein